MYGCYDFFFNDTATTEIYTLSLHDALPICPSKNCSSRLPSKTMSNWPVDAPSRLARSEEHTSELQSQSNLVCRLLLEKKKRTDLDTSALAAHAAALGRQWKALYEGTDKTAF